MHHRNKKDCAGGHSHVWNKVLINLIKNISNLRGGIKYGIKSNI